MHQLGICQKYKFFGVNQALIDASASVHTAKYKTPARLKERESQAGQSQLDRVRVIDSWNKDGPIKDIIRPPEQGEREFVNSKL